MAKAIYREQGRKDWHHAGKAVKDEYRSAARAAIAAFEAAKLLPP